MLPLLVPQDARVHFVAGFIPQKAPAEGVGKDQRNGRRINLASLPLAKIATAESTKLAITT